jgi:glycosyltransferase involved in cell wall biosynthesis
MRIAFFTECYHPIVNGVVVSVSTFAKELTEQGHEVRIYAPAYPGHRDEEDHVHRMPSLSLPTHPVYPLAIPYYSSFRLWPTLTAHRPDIIHAHHPFLACREARRLARRLHCPLVLTYHTLIHAYAHYVPLPRPLVRSLAVFVSQEYANSTDCVVVPTEGVGELLRSYGVHRPIEVIPTGIDLGLIDGTPRRPARAQFGVPEGVPVIAYSGRIAREKNLALLIEAVARLPAGFREAHLLLIGGGPWDGHCQELAKAEGLAGRVHITGYLPRERVFDCLAESQVFAFPSLTDTQGVAVLEAMALRCALVAVRSMAVEALIRDQRDGLVVEATAEELAEGIAALLGSEQLRRRLAGQARARAEEFSSGRMAERLALVYAKLL